MKKWLYIKDAKAIFLLTDEHDLLELVTSQTKLSMAVAVMQPLSSRAELVQDWYNLSKIVVHCSDDTMTFIPVGKSMTSVFSWLVGYFNRLKRRNQIWVLNNSDDIAMFKLLFEDQIYEFDN